MKFWTIFIYMLTSLINPLQAHEGHHHPEKEALAVENSSNDPTISFDDKHVKNQLLFDKSIKWLGQFHFVAVHFPIALIIMTVLAEIIHWWSKNDLYEQAARFMIIAAAFISIPTALFGLALSYQVNYTGELASIYWWHKSFGFDTVLFSCCAAWFAKTLEFKREFWFIYYVSLGFAFVGVCGAGFLGGEMAFGPTLPFPLFE